MSSKPTDQLKHQALCSPDRDVGQHQGLVLSCHQNAAVMKKLPRKVCFMEAVLIYNQVAFSIYGTSSWKHQVSGKLLRVHCAAFPVLSLQARACSISLLPVFWVSSSLLIPSTNGTNFMGDAIYSLVGAVLDPMAKLSYLHLFFW